MVKINLLLTKESAFDLGYRWTRDIQFPQSEMNDFYQLLEEKEYLLGAPQTIVNKAYGLYEPLKEISVGLLEELPLNKYISIANCSKMGYEYIGDVFYDPEAPHETMELLIHKVKNEGYILGLQDMLSNGYLPLYKPIQDSNS